MDDLIARLEAAQAGSRELDARIKIALDDPLVMTNCGDAYGRGGIHEHASTVFGDDWLDWDAAAIQCQAPPYTASLDAALTLVPMGWWMTLRCGKPIDQTEEYCHALLWHDADSIDRDDDESFEVSANNAPTCALALCIAALKARAAAGEHHGR